MCYYSYLLLAKLYFSLAAPCNKNNNCNFIPITQKPSIKSSSSRRPKKFKGICFNLIFKTLKLICAQAPLFVISPPVSPGAWPPLVTTERPAGASQVRRAAGGWRAAEWSA